MKNVLITGCSSGYGLETARHFHAQGWNVIATMRTPREGILPASDRLRVVALDVTKPASIAASIEAAGPIDVLVNNAGIERRGSIEELPLDEFRAVMETNYFGAIRCMQAVLPGMRARGKGCIVNISSVAGRISSAPLGPYAASKFALEAISEAVAQEVKSLGIRVAVVQPGIISTDMAHAIGIEGAASIYPHGRRFADLFTASLQRPTSPDLVADTIRGIVESDSPRFHYPVGPDAEPFLAWRASMTDEQWTDWNAADDDTWYANVEQTFGLKARRPKTQSAG